MTSRFINLGSLTSQTAGTAVDISELDSVGVAVGGTFNATYSVEVSFDGSTFVAHPDFAGLTAAKSGALGFVAKQVRLNVTAYTSGTVTGGGGGKK